LVEETRVLGENHRPVASHWQTLSHNVVHLALIEIRMTTLIYILLTEMLFILSLNIH
jgi:hypothetical protein